MPHEKEIQVFSQRIIRLAFLMFQFWILKKELNSIGVKRFLLAETCKMLILVPQCFRNLKTDVPHIGQPTWGTWVKRCGARRVGGYFMP